MPSAPQWAQGQGGHSSGQERSPGGDRPRTADPRPWRRHLGRRVSGEDPADWSGFAGKAGWTRQREPSSGTQGVDRTEQVLKRGLSQRSPRLHRAYEVKTTFIIMLRCYLPFLFLSNLYCGALAGCSVVRALARGLKGRRLHTGQGPPLWEGDQALVGGGRAGVNQ